MKQRLATDASLQPLLAQYVPLVLDVNTPEFRVWTQRFRPSGNGIPMLFIVSAEGEVVYNRSGAPQGDGLQRLLEEGIANTGGPKELASPLSPRVQRQFDLVVRRATAMLEKEDIGGAVTAVAAMLKKAAASGAEDGADMPATGHKEFDQLAAALIEQARDALDKPDEVRSAGKPLLAAVALAQAKRLFAPLPAVKPQLDQAVAALSEENSELWRQAEMIDRAEALRQAGSARSASVAYQRVLEAFPDGEAAEFSRARLAELGEPASTAPTAADAERTWRDATGRFEVAATLIRFDGAAATLKRRDGRIITVPLEKLDAAAQEYLQAQQTSNQR